MKKITILLIVFLVGCSLLAARPQPNLKQRLLETNAPTIAATQTNSSNPPVGPSKTPDIYWPTVADWQSPTPSGDLYAVREGFPIGGDGPIYVTPAVRSDDWSYPMFSTPCRGWIDANQVLFCVTATPAPLYTNTPPAGYP